MSHRLVKIDDLTRSDHFYLTKKDNCYFVMEYTSGKDYRYSVTNGLIKNFKKTLDRRTLPEWVYKGRAIRAIADIFRPMFSEQTLDGVTIVPVPPSKCKTDAMYDDRLVQLINQFTDGYTADIREIIYLEESIEASHDTDDRSTPNELEEVYLIDEDLCDPKPQRIIIFDDMITAGAHFRACKNMLQQRFPKAEIVGVFISRRILPTEE